MLGAFFLFSLFCAGMLAQPDMLLEDRIKGAIIGSAVGDSLGRLTLSMGKVETIKQKYGPQGLIGSSNFQSDDWFAIDGKRVALVSTNTLFALNALEAMKDIRKSNRSLSALAVRLADAQAAYFGDKKLEIDPQAQLRKPNAFVLTHGAELVKLKKENSQTEWWTRTKESINKEDDSSSLPLAWPAALVFADKPDLAIEFASHITTIANRHPGARAASAAIAAGVGATLRGLSVDDTVEEMIKAAEKYDEEELIYKDTAAKIMYDVDFRTDLIDANRMLTSDMIRYASYAAKTRVEPLDFLGTIGKKRDNNRSYRGYVLGYQADEAVAAAVYLFIKYPFNFEKAMRVAVNSAGNTALIASLTGALIGAKNGFNALSKDGLPVSMKDLEKSKELKVAAREVYAVLSSGVEYNPGSCSKTKTILGLGVVGLAGWLSYKYGIPYIQAYMAKK